MNLQGIPWLSSGEAARIQGRELPSPAAPAALESVSREFETLLMASWLQKAMPLQNHGMLSEPQDFQSQWAWGLLAQTLSQSIAQQGSWGLAQEINRELQAKNLSPG